MRLENLNLESAGQDGMWGASWGFILLSDMLVLNEYRTWTRASKRHKPVTKDYWSRLNSREANIKKAEVPFTPAIAAWAKREWIKQLEANVTVGFQD